MEEAQIRPHSGEKQKNKFTLKSFYLLIFAVLLLVPLITAGLVKQNQDYRQIAQTPPFLTRNGQNFLLNDQEINFTGINAYELATLWTNNRGCGPQLSDSELNSFFASLRPNTLVRMWAWQGSMAINPNNNQIDWTAIDRIINAASQHEIKLIVSLGSQDGTCDDTHWKDVAWYNGGYRNIINDGSYYSQLLSYWDYVGQIVLRYKDSPTIAMWEPINEPEATQCASGFKGSECYAHLSCPDENAASGALQNFFTEIGTHIKSIDPNHLIESGVIGSGQCGAIAEDYKALHANSFIDVASYHDYSAGTETMPGDQWNGLGERLAQAAELNKPLIIGEVGILANDLPNCVTTTGRLNQMKAKMDAMFAAGIRAFIPWNLVPSNTGTCSYDILPLDPLLSLLNTYQLPGYPIPTPTSILQPSPTITPTISPIPTETACNKKGDLNCDNKVGILDLSILLSNWNTTNVVADINKDGTVGILDLSIILSNWGL